MGHNDIYINNYLIQAAKITELIDRIAVKNMVDILVEIRQSSGRLFIIGRRRRWGRQCLSRGQ